MAGKIIAVYLVRVTLREPEVDGPDSEKVALTNVEMQDAVRELLEEYGFTVAVSSERVDV